MSLTQNGVHRLVNLNEFENDSNFRPTFQVLRVIAVNAAAPNGEQKTRYRVILSDGIHHCQGMLATQNNNRVTSGEVVDHVLLKINDCLFNNIQNKALVIVLGFDVIGDNPGVKIGTPTDIGVPIGSKNKGQGQGQGQGQGGNGNNGNMPQAQQPVRANIKPENTYSNNNHNNNSYNNNNRQNNNSYGNNNNNNNSYGNNNNRNSNPYGSTSSGSIIRTTTPSSTKPITPISQLNMYQNRWTIKARITSKSQIRTWSNTKGEGKLFSLELLDENCDIRSTFFKEAVDKFYDMLQVNTVYTFSGGRLKAANMQYNTCKSSFEITFDQNAEIVKADDDGMILQQSYTLVPIASLENTEPGGYVDVMGVVKRVGEPGTIMSKKTGRELSKCEVTIGDDSGADVSVTIWGEKAMTAPNDFANNPIVAFRRARLSDYGGRTLSANGDGINIRPNVPEAEKLLEWWNTGGKSQNGQAKSLSSSMGGGANRFPKFEDRKSIASIKGENLGYTSAEKPDWISFKGTFNFIKSDREGGAWYSACPNPNDPCKSRCKVTMAHEGSYMCDRCNQSFESCLHRYIFSATISDDTSTTWVSVFDDQAKVLLNGKTADELHEILNGEGGQSEYDGHFARAHFTDWVFTCKVKQEMNQDEMRIKTTIQSIHPMDYAKEGNSLLNSILSM